MKNKADIWKADNDWAFVKENDSGNAVFIQNSSNETYLGVKDNKVVTLSQYENATEQIWIKGIMDNEGYFTLTNASTSKVLTAKNEHEFEIKGKV